MSNTTIILIVIAAVLCFLYSIYVSVIKAKNKAEEASSSIDVQLKKRYDLIPNILQIANKFMEHERSLMEEITKLRSKAMEISDGYENMPKKLELDKLIKDKMAQVMVAVENYPNLKSDAMMIQAMTTYSEVEEHIAAARRFYNSAVLELNNKVEIFPSSIFASMLGIKKQTFFQVDEKETKSINTGDYLK